jgi:hypothetical protein
MGDPRDVPPDQTIRDDSYPVATASLLVAGSETVPDELIRDLLIAEWKETQAAPRPEILVRDERVQVDLRRSDAIAVEVESYQERFNGHRHEHVDIEVTLALTIRTAASRARLWALMAEARRIVYRWKLALQPYHSLYFDGFYPEYVGPNVWQGTMRVRLTADAIPEYLRRVEGEESPSSDPGVSGPPPQAQ